ncbi:MAG TPA: hypothetical protein VFH31_05075 [Pyrinomonadaceae bacterium]|nr:hypothetical protein [Pyrinomonadaceae bacterium]
MAQTLVCEPAERTIIENFDAEFAGLHGRSCRLIESTPLEVLYHAPFAPKAEVASSHSVGEYVLRSAGVVEQTFGGITTNLWDDPFEWTLPETLSTPARVMEYLSEVEQTRQHAFASFRVDRDLLKRVATPSDNMRPIISLLLDTLVRAQSHQGRALFIVETLSLSEPNRFII